MEKVFLIFLILFFSCICTSFSESEKDTEKAAESGYLCQTEPAHSASMYGYEYESDEEDPEIPESAADSGHPVSAGLEKENEERIITQDYSGSAPYSTEDQNAGISAGSSENSDSRDAPTIESYTEIPESVVDSKTQSEESIKAADDLPCRLAIPQFTKAGTLIKPYVIRADGITVDDYSGIRSARAYVYGGGYDHRDILLSRSDNFDFSWDGTFPKDEIRENGVGKPIVVSGSVRAPAGWYWLTVETTDIHGNTSCSNSRIHTENIPAQMPADPGYTVFEISGRVDTADSLSITVDGTRYLLADFSRIGPGIAKECRVTGTGRFYSKENVAVIDTLILVHETITPFSGIAEDIGDTYVIIDGRAMLLADSTERYCSDIRTGDYVYGFYKEENSTKIVTEFGLPDCDRNSFSRTDTGIVTNITGN